MNRQVERRRAVAAGLLPLVLALVGCASVPVAGPVVYATRVGQTGNQLGVAISPDPPVKGATPALIVDGFLHAMASAQGDYAGARQYLTADAQKAWVPQAGVSVYADGYSPKAVEDDVLLNAPLVGRVSRDGGFTGAGQASVTHDFKLVKDAEDQWRISNPPEGLLLSSYLFNTSFARVVAYFVDPAATSVVPDPLYVARLERTPTNAVRRLLAGPTPWLKPAVATYFPAGTQLLSSVWVDTFGVATVPLSWHVRGLGDRGRTLLTAQIAWTLSQFPEISAVRITAEGQAIGALYARTDGSVTIASLDEFDPVLPRANTQLFGLLEGRLVVVREIGPQLKALTTIGPFGTQRSDLKSFAISADAAEAAVVTSAGEVLQGGVNAGQVRTILSQPGMLRPQYARSGELWLIATDAGRTTVTRWADGKAQPVETPGLRGVEVFAFRVSPDATRIAVAGMVDGKAQLGLLRIERGEAVKLDGWTPLGLADLSMPHDQIPDVAWASPISLLVLAGNATRTQAEAYVLDEDGSLAVDIGRSDNWGATSVATVPRAASRTMLLGAKGAVWKYEDAYRWTQVLTGFTAICFPG